MTLFTELTRRIEKLIKGLTIRPDIPPVGTNHADNANQWTDNSIYKGELALNLDSGEIYSQDGVEAVAFGRENAILEGLVVSTSGVSLTEINISSGKVRILGREYYYDSTNDIDDGGVSVESNIDIYPRIDVIAVKGDLSTFNSTKNMYGVEFKVFQGDEASDIPIRDIPSDYKMLGLVMVVPNQSISDVLRPRSLSTSDSSYPLFAKTPKDFVKEIKSNVEDWSPNTLFFTGQVLKSDGNLYQVALSYVSADSLTTDINNVKLVPLGGLSNSNITRFVHVGSSPTDTYFTDGYFEDWNSNTRILDAFDDISEWVKRVAPTKPVNIANANLYMYTSNFTAGISHLGLGNNVSNVIDSNSIPEARTTNWFTPSTFGAIKSYYTTPSTSYSTDNLTLNNLTNHPPAQTNVITDASNVYTFTVVKNDPYENVVWKQGFYTALNVNLKTITTVSPSPSAYSYRIKHFSTGAEANLTFYAETARTPNVTTVSNYKANIIGNVKYLSGLPVLKATDRIQMDITVDNAVRYFYNTTNVITIDSDVTLSKGANLSNIEYLTLANRPPFTQLANANSNSIVVAFSNVESNILANALISEPVFSIRAFNAVGGNVVYTTPALTIPVDDVTVEANVRLYAGVGTNYPSGTVGVNWGNVYSNAQSQSNIMLNTELQYFGGQYFYPNVDYTTTISTATQGANVISYPNYLTTGNTTFRWAMFKLGNITAQKFYTFKIKDTVGFGYDLEDGITMTNNLKLFMKVSNSSNVLAGTGWLDLNKSYNLSEAEEPYNDGDKALDLSFGDENPDLRRATFGDVERTGDIYVRIGTDKKGMQFSNIVEYTGNTEVSEFVWSEFNLGEIVDETYVVVKINGTNGTLTSDFLDGITMTSDFYAQLKVEGTSGVDWIDFNSSYPANGFIPVDYGDPALDLTYYTGEVDPTIRKVTFGPTTRTGNVSVRLRKTGCQVFSNVELI